MKLNEIKNISLWGFSTVSEWWKEKKINGNGEEMINDAGGKPGEDDILDSKWSKYIDKEQMTNSKCGWEVTEQEE